MSYKEAENYQARLDAAQEAYSAARDRYGNTKVRVWDTDILNTKKRNRPPMMSSMKEKRLKTHSKRPNEG